MDPNTPREHVFYAHSDKHLYRIDPRTNALSDVGAFGGDFAADDIATDIAVNAAGEVYIITYDKVMRVDPATASATFLANLSNSQATSLTFLPLDFANPSGGERLVGGAGNQLMEIDTSTGTVTNIGTLGAAYLAGDLFYVRGVGIYATISGNPDSVLARVDETTFEATAIGPTGFNNVWGLAYYGGTFYGFNFDFSTPPYGGYMFTIDETTGAGTLVRGFENATFYGAGVTTVAPDEPVS